MTIDIESILTLMIVPLGWKLIQALLIWFVGSWAGKIIVKILARSLALRKIETTVARYLETSAGFLIRLLIIIAILGVLGIETTSFTALLAATGIAIGAAWGGLLANFAAGVFLVFLRPYKVGDSIHTAGVTGTVREIGIFATVLDAADNTRIYVGNNKVFSDNITNYTTNPYRRANLMLQISHDADPYQVIELLRERIANIPNLLHTPEPVIEVVEYNPYGTLIAVRPCCHPEHFAQVSADANKAIYEAKIEGKLSTPEQRIAVRNLA